VPFWKKRKEPVVRKGLRQCVLQGTSREELLQETLAEMVEVGGADRFGVWLEPTSDDTKNEGALRGMVWDREIVTSPREWISLSPQTVLPPARVVSGSATEIDLTGKTTQPIVGPLVGLNRALWVPVQHAGKLRGVLLAGTSGTRKELPREKLLELSVELAIALAFETERKVARERHTDLTLLGKILTELQTSDDFTRLFQEVLASCVMQEGSCESLGAIYAGIAKIHRTAEDGGSKEITLELLGEAGDSKGQFATHDAVLTLVRRAVESGKTMGAEIRRRSTEEAPRVIVVPLLVHGKVEHVLLSAFRQEWATLASVERTKLRGNLAASVLSAMHEKGRIVSEEKQKRAILDASLDPIVMLGADGMIMESNRAAQGLLQPLPVPADGGLTEPEAHRSAGRRLAEIFRVRDREKVSSWQRRQWAPKTAESNESPDFELESGTRVRLRSQKSGESLQVITLIPESRPAKAEEKRVEAELLNLVEWLDQGVILFDGEMNVRLLNLRFAQLAGLAPEEVERYRTLDGLAERLSSQCANPGLFSSHWREQALRAEGGEREEVNFVRPVARVLERASRPVFDASGKRIGRIELYKDLTAQRVFQAKLLQTERLAALGQMVSGVAHELSNPLTSILGYAQRLLLRSDGEGNFEEIRKISGEAERAGAILRRMLLAARETAPERKPVSLNQIVQRTIDLQRFSLAAERIRVDVSLDATVPNVMGDAGQLQQVLINLIGNARQAIESQGHGGTIRLRTWRTQDERVRLEVSDSGPGIPEGIMARIFDPFFTTKPAGVGTGLGLSIVLSLVREHGGQVSVSSPRGSGAIFLIELPSAEQKDTTERIVQRVSAAQTLPRKDSAGEVPARRPSGTQRVLIVEDEPTVAQLISDVLRDEGFEIQVLLDGRDAVQRASRERFDLIICDMKMPNLDGQTLYQTLSVEGKGAQNQFLFVTGDVLGAKTHDFLTKNQLQHVAKPFRVEELLEKVHEVLQPLSNCSRHGAALRKNSATTG
jgi:signal transduction histidine kinase/ActR/RegA family two-component response regulator